ncbi:MAG: hypothetical protein RJB26_895, partial [Pseudomonadota bacterium]
MQRKTIARAVSALLLLAGAGVTTGAFGEAAQQGFYGVIKAGVFYINNPLTVGPGQAKKGDEAARLTPQVGYRRNTDHVEVDVSYAMDAVQYANTDGLNSVQHKILARALWKALPEWLSVEARATRLQQAADPLGASNLNGLLGDANRVDVDSAALGPRLRHEFGNTLLQGRYTFTRTRYGVRGQLVNGYVRDANDQDGYISWGTDKDEGRFGWQVEAKHQRTTYGSSAFQPFQYDRVGVNVNVPVGSRWSIIAGGGKESDVSVSSSKGGLDSTVWEAGLRWGGPQNQTHFEAAYGKRYFGNSFRAAFSRQAKFLTLSASYSEEPTTETSRLTRAVPTFVVGTDSPINAPFLLKEAEFTAMLTGSRTVLEVQAYERRRDFGVTVLRGDDLRRGVSGRITRQLSSRMDFSFDGSWEQVQIDGRGGYKQAEGGLELSREIGA